jgi:basic membrane lipoprotein Med (substrate-binding protein (PBP1-ABC) superfamily)
MPKRLPLYIGFGLLLSIVVTLAVIQLLPTDPEPPRERQYRDTTACLLTDAGGIAAARTAPVWAGMQDASLKTHAKVQYLAIPGEQTPNNAEIYLTSLAQGGCDVLLAAGELPAGAVAAIARAFPDLAFVAIPANATPATTGSGAASPPVVVGPVVDGTNPANVTTVTSGTDLRAAVAEIVTTAVGPG